VNTVRGMGATRILHRPGSILALCLFLLLFPGQVAATRAAGPERPRSSLVQVYEKVWKRQSTEGDLTRFVGD
jgi:hypothetical protein